MLPRLSSTTRGHACSALLCQSYHTRRPCVREFSSRYFLDSSFLFNFFPSLFLLSVFGMEFTTH